MNPEHKDDQCESDIDGFPVGSPHSPVLEDPDCDGCREEFGHPENCIKCPYRNHPKAKPTPDPTKLDFSKLSETKISKMEGEPPAEFECDVECSMEATSDDCYECQKEQGVLKEPPAEEGEALATLEQLIERGLVCPICHHDKAWHKCELCGCVQRDVKYEPPTKEPSQCIATHPKRDICNGYRDGLCVIPERRDEICSQYPLHYDGMESSAKEPDTHFDRDVARQELEKAIRENPLPADEPVETRVLKPIPTREPRNREQQLSQDLEPENEGKWTCDNCGAARIDEEKTCRLCGDMVWVRHQLEEPEKKEEK